MNESTGLGFDDIRVGQEFETGKYLMTEASIKSFAAEFDPQPMHLDEQAAADGPFGQLTASGWQTLSLAMKLMVEARPLGSTPLLGIAVDEIRFVEPVYANTTIYVHATVTEKRVSSKPGRGFAKIQLNIINAENRQIVASKIWTVLIPRFEKS